MAVKALWNDDSIRKTYLERNEGTTASVRFHVIDSMDYFFGKIDDFLNPGYSITISDALRVSSKTRHISKCIISLPQCSLKMIDTYGRRDERSIWSQFKNPQAIFYVTSLGEYDQFLKEEDTQPRMRESLLLFEEICNSTFIDSTIFLFLNKEDIFRDKIKQTDLNVCFKDYDGGCNYQNALNYIKSRFIEKVNTDPDRESQRNVYVHITCAIDTGNIEYVFSEVQKKLAESAKVM